MLTGSNESCFYIISRVDIKGVEPMQAHVPYQPSSEQEQCQQEYQCRNAAKLTQLGGAASSELFRSLNDAVAVPRNSSG